MSIVDDTLFFYKGFGLWVHKVVLPKVVGYKYGAFANKFILWFDLFFALVVQTRSGAQQLFVEFDKNWSADEKRVLNFQMFIHFALV